MVSLVSLEAQQIGIGIGIVIVMVATVLVAHVFRTLKKSRILSQRDTSGKTVDLGLSFCPSFSETAVN